MKPKPSRTAFGWPGIEPRWTHGDKDGVGTAYAASSRIWFTLWNGVITEVYYPTVDHPQIRDLQYLVTDGKTFFHEEKRHLKSKCERLSDHALGYRITNIDPGGRYAIIKEVITDPHSGCILQHTQLSGDERFISKLRLYTLCAPHLQVGGSSNNGHVIEVAGRKILMAQKKGIWLALGGTVNFSRTSCGYVGRSDGWTDLARPDRARHFSQRRQRLLRPARQSRRAAGGNNGRWVAAFGDGGGMAERGGLVCQGTRNTAVPGNLSCSYVALGLTLDGTAANASMLGTNADESNNSLAFDK